MFAIYVYFALLHRAREVDDAEKITRHSQYKQSLALRVRRYVVIPTKPVHRLQIRPFAQ